MPKSKELSVHMEDRPGVLGNCCRVLAEGGVNIVAFQAFPFEGQSVVRLLVDDPTKAEAVLDSHGLYHTETEIAFIRLPHQPGELGRAARRLAEANININYAYSGAEPGSNAPLIVFGVAEAGRAAALLDEIAAKAA